MCAQGSVAQNRAVEGDVVALQILPPSSWFISSALVKASNDGGSSLHHSASTPAALTAGALQLPEEGSPEPSLGSCAEGSVPQPAMSDVPSGELPLVCKSAGGPVGCPLLVPSYIIC